MRISKENYQQVPSELMDILTVKGPADRKQWNIFYNGDVIYCERYGEEYTVDSDAVEANDK